MRRPATLTAIALGVLFGVSCGGSAHDQPGQAAPEEPIQEAVDEAPFEHEGYRIIPLASYQLEARVLGTERYRFDRESDLAPVDLALGWGPMSDPAVLEHFRIGQAFRAYAWHVREFPIPREQVETHSANVHLIPATGSIERRLKSVDEGDVIALEGRLVEAAGEDGWRWRSSLTREDTGTGSCELVYVTALEVR